MYPSEELNQLARRKVVLRGSIAVNRWRCVSSAHRLAQPLEWVDRGMDLWQRLSPLIKFGALPIGLLFKRSALPKSSVLGGIGSLLKWAPTILSAFRAFKGMRSQTPAPNSDSL